MTVGSGRGSNKAWEETSDDMVKVCEVMEDRILRPQVLIIFKSIKIIDIETKMN